MSEPIPPALRRPTFLFMISLFATILLRWKQLLTTSELIQPLSLISKVETLANKATTSSSARTYVVDAVCLSSAQLRPIFDLFESDDIRKVFFDGRKDYCALYHEHHVTLQNVIDMQIADVVSRTMRGEDQDDQQKRLYGFMHPPEVRGQSSSYVNVHMLNGLRKCAQATNQAVSHTLWMQRPLTAEYLKYAASDVFLIHALYNHFIEKRTSSTWPHSLPQSMRYVSMWRNNQPESGDIYLCGASAPSSWDLREPSYHCGVYILQESTLTRRIYEDGTPRSEKKVSLLDLPCDNSQMGNAEALEGGRRRARRV
ncbi:hypothetical protein BDZ89DRAFT_498357 [Hymenopellis radicata]|nr:hypothetical protein BDZ89DRAFT_498357 [Hymenopellis radicata]